MTSRAPSTPADLAALSLIPRAPSRARCVWVLARQNPVGSVCTIILIGMIIAAVFAPYIAPYSPYAVYTGPSLAAPSAHNLLGTDSLGRDVLSRMLYGARVSLAAGFISVGAGTIAGAIIGFVSGFIGGWVDLVAQRIVEMLLAFPALILALVLLASLGRGSDNAMIAIAVVLAPATARVMRGVVLQVKERPFIEATASLGASNSRLLLRHVVPNCLDEVLILGSNALGAAVIIEASLSFLGLGAQPPTASWGQMLADGQTTFQQSQAMVWVPSAAISITVFVVVMIGDMVRDILDPKVRGRA